MPIRSTTLLLLTALASSLTACAHNPWWEAERSGWVLYGRAVDVPRKAQPVPLAMLPEASRWDTALYVEAWIESVDQQDGGWATIGDGTSPPVMLLLEDGFTIPRNARGRRILAWGRPLVAEGSVRSADGASDRTQSIDLLAKAVLIQGFYGLEPAPRPASERGDAEPTGLPTPRVEPVGGNEDPARGEAMTTESTPAGVVDLPD